MKCPVVSDFCGHFEDRCPMDCYGNNGICMNGNTCHCFDGFAGEDCVSFSFLIFRELVQIVKVILIRLF